MPSFFPSLLFVSPLFGVTAPSQLALLLPFLVQLPLFHSLLVSPTTPYSFSSPSALKGLASAFPDSVLSSLSLQMYPLSRTVQQPFLHYRYPPSSE